MSNKRLDEDFPASPAPGTVLIPPAVSDGRFLTRQQGGSYDCDECTNVGLQGAAGTWEDDDAMGATGAEQRPSLNTGQKLHVAMRA
eukprot:1297438-Pyramimonas_sp.AAC.1